ncbi:MAG: lamin tail domain-containing protein [Limisphaerales bacterium]
MALGNTHALYGVRTVAASGIGSRLTNATLRLFDHQHDSVGAWRVTGVPDVFDTDLNGPVFARYVRVGLEDKQRTDPAGGREWYLGMREVQVFGRPIEEVGILSFASSSPRIDAGQAVTLTWEVEDVHQLGIWPETGSVGRYTEATGRGQLTIAPARTTEYLLVATNAAGRFTRAVTVVVGAAVAPVRISEIVADNRFSLEDGEGDAPDWIELRNTGDEGVNLAGYGLSDDASAPMKWRMPATHLAPHSMVVVFASGREVPFDDAGGLHAPFRLDQAGGVVVLTAPDGITTVDVLPASPALDTDLAYGRDLGGNWGFMEPTPGEVNTGVDYLGWLGTVDFSERRGFHESPFTLALTHDDPGATLLYSTDGSEPSLAYSGAVAVAGTRTVRARLVRPGYRSGRIQTHTFVFLAEVIRAPNMRTSITQNAAYAPRLGPGLRSLPTVSIVLPGQPEYGEKPGSIEVLWPDGQPAAQADCGVSRFGGSWQEFAKKSFRIKCRSRYGTARLETPLFDGFDRGLPARDSFDELEFRSGSQDMVDRGFYMAGPFVADTLLDMGAVVPHSRFVHLYLNGAYWGQYDARESFGEHFLADYLGGSPKDYVSVRGNDNVGDTFTVGTPDPPHVESWERVLSLRNSFTEVRPHLDVASLIDFMLMWFYGDCESEYRAGGPWGVAGTGFKFWEADADGYLRTSALGQNRTGNAGPAGLFGALMKEADADFKMLLADRIHRHFFHGGALMPAANAARLQARMDEIQDSLLLECARWGYRTPSNWGTAAATIQSQLFPTRTTQLLSDLRAAKMYPAFDPPEFELYGGLVTNGYSPSLSSSSGTIYYTLDGTDPRQPGGQVSAQALVWKPGAVGVTRDLTFSARVRTTTGQWSALATPHFWVAPRRAPGVRDLLITEIHYHPPDSSSEEFIELYNASTELLDLSGVSLADAVRFTFPGGVQLDPGAWVVVAKDPEAFAARYQSVSSPVYFAGLTMVGPWTGSLDNAEETLALVAADGTGLSVVEYQPEGEWPDRADGWGSSLELGALPSGDASDDAVRSHLANAANWRPSARYHGSPGRFDSFAGTLRLNELGSDPVTGEEWVELWNGGRETVELGGWTLTDDPLVPRRWTFPFGTRLGAGQYLVLNRGQLGFGLAGPGDRTFLMEISGTNGLRFQDSVRFLGAESSEAWGVFDGSDGISDFTRLRKATPGARNALPRIGSVVISEILLKPVGGRAQFIELTSLTNGPVPLHDPLRPTNGWSLGGIGDFTFPPGTVIEACGSLIVCSTNPASFRAQYGLAPSVPVYGPWPGVLQERGEPLELRRPGEPQTDGRVPVFREDHVSLQPGGRWPAAEAGLSWERVPIEGHGNDPASWRPGPVNGSPGEPATNRAPTLVLTGDLVTSPGVPLVLDLLAVDLDEPWQSVELLPVQLPPGGRFEAASGQILWTPSEAQTGDFPLEFVARDQAACGPIESHARWVIQVVPSLTLSARIKETGIELRFPVVAGETYRVEYADDPADGPWELLQALEAAPTGIVTVIDAAPVRPRARFYRVLWIQKSAN